MDKRDSIVKITNILTFELLTHDQRVNVQDFVRVITILKLESVTLTDMLMLKRTIVNLSRFSH